MTIYERIDDAYELISKAVFKKDKWVGKYIVTRDANNNKVRQPDLSQDGYYVISITQILDVVQKAHAQFGIKCIFEGPYYDSDNNEKRITVPWRDSKRTIANGHYDVRIYGEGPEDVIEMRVQCEAWDTEANDKLGNKLLTNAQRSLYRSLYAIDGDDSKDPEEENPAVQGALTERPTDDPFFGKKAPAETPTEAPKPSADTSATEASVTEPAPEKDNANIRQATACRKAIDEWISEDYNRTNNEIITEYVKSNGPMDQWAFGTMVHCYKDLRDSGEKLKEVNL